MILLNSDVLENGQSDLLLKSLFNLDLNLEISDTICSSLNLKLSSRFQDLQGIMNIQLIGRKP